MVNTCTAVNCKSNYKSSLKHHPPIPVFKFPQDPGLFNEWYRRIYRSRSDFTESKAKKAFVCALHFTEDDFVDQTEDTNKWRTSPGSTLVRKLVKFDSKYNFKI